MTLEEKQKNYQQFSRNYLVLEDKTFYLCRPKPRGKDLVRGAGKEFLEMLAKDFEEGIRGVFKMRFVLHERSSKSFSEKLKKDFGE